MAKAKIVYSCTECGGQTLKWQGQCPHCAAWNTLSETLAEPPDGALSRLGADQPSAELANDERGRGAAP